MSAAYIYIRASNSFVYSVCLSTESSYSRWITSVFKIVSRIISYSNGDGASMTVGPMVVSMLVLLSPLRSFLVRILQWIWIKSNCACNRICTYVRMYAPYVSVYFTRQYSNALNNVKSPFGFLNKRRYDVYKYVHPDILIECDNVIGFRHRPFDHARIQLLG